MKFAGLLMGHAGALYSWQQAQAFMPVALVPDRRPSLQDKAQDIVLGAYAVPDEEGDGIALALPQVVPFLGAEFDHTCMHRAMQAFLLQQEEIDNVQGLLSFLSMFQLISFYPVLWQTERVFDLIAATMTYRNSSTRHRRAILRRGLDLNT